MGRIGFRWVSFNIRIPREDMIDSLIIWRASLKYSSSIRGGRRGLCDNCNAEGRSLGLCCNIQLRTMWLSCQYQTLQIKWKHSRCFCCARFGSQSSGKTMSGRRSFCKTSILSAPVFILWFISKKTIWEKSPSAQLFTNSELVTYSQTVDICFAMVFGTAAAH